MVISDALPQSVQKHRTVHTKPYAKLGKKREAGLSASRFQCLLADPPIHPSQDVACPPWSGTSFASTPKTSCPGAPALINRKISVCHGLSVTTEVV